MGEKPIKVDEETDRLVSELAYLLGCTKKSVVREAVAELAQARRRTLTRTPESSASTPVPESSASTRAPDSGAPGRVPVSSAAASGPAGAVISPAADVGLFGGATTPPFGELPLRQRLALRRSELIREFARNGASNLRLLGQLAEGGDADELELVADTDLLDGSGAIPKLQAVARRLMAAPVHVTSTTALRLFDPEGLARTLSASRPL